MDKGLKKFKWYELIKNHYDIAANNYDDSHLKIGSAGFYVEQRRRECILPMINNGGKILDVACGTGYYLQLLSNNDCFGMDFAEKMIKRCREKDLKNVLVGNYEVLPFGNNIFDIVLCINAFQHTKNPDKVLNEINRVVKEDGEIILTYFNLLNPRMIVHLTRDIFRTKMNIAQRYTYASIQRMCNKAGLNIIESYGCNFLPYRPIGKKRNEAVLKVFESFEKGLRGTSLKHISNEVILRLRKYQ